MKNKEYLGDGVYVTFDGYHVTLTAENGIEAHDTIYLDPHVQLALVKYFERLVKGEVGVDHNVSR